MSTALHICSLFALENAIETFSPDLIISIADPKSVDAAQADKILEKTDVPSVTLRFHDSTYSDLNAKLITFGDFDLVKEAIDAHCPADNPRVLVHCYAGHSRSPAMAIFALGYIADKKSSLDDTTCAAIIDQVYTTVPTCEPNTRVLDMGSMALDVPGFFHQAIRDRKEKLTKPKSSLRSKMEKKKKRKLFRS